MSEVFDDGQAMTTEEVWWITVAHLGSLGLLAGVLGLPFSRCLRSGKIGNNMLAVWFGLMAWGALFCLYVPSKLSEMVKNQAVWEFFPEATGMTLFMALGWVIGLALCGVALVLRHGGRAGMYGWQRLRGLTGPWERQ